MRATRLRMVAILVASAVFATACTAALGQSENANRVLKIRFDRAVQLFAGNTARVLGVEVGRVIDVQVIEGAAEATVRISDPDLQLPADVRATIVPLSLLGERYVQMFPAYEGGPTFEGDLIDLDRTAVPAEQDELLQGLKDYFGAIDPATVSEFVSNAATILEGNGANVNHLIDKGADVFDTLARKRNALAGLISELNTLTLTLSTRQAALARVINSYNTVGRSLNANREALEGTIEGLNLAATQLAGLLIETRDPLGKDIRSLTRTFRTLSRNAKTFARTGKWAKRLFDSASRAVDYERNWLRLGNQGAPLESLIIERLQDRLIGVCIRLEVEQCSGAGYWEERLPSIFCALEGSCSEKDSQTPGEALDEALDELGMKKGFKKCKKAKHPRRCKKRQKAESEGRQLDELINDILNGLADTMPSLGRVR